eukprot:3819882-Amphidinium_carterae.1
MIRSIAQENSSNIVLNLGYREIAFGWSQHQHMSEEFFDALVAYPSAETDLAALRACLLN